MNLTCACNHGYPLLTAPHWAGGFLQARLELAQRRYASTGVCLFLCPHFLWWAAYLGGESLAASSRSANPDMLSTAQVFAGLFGGFNSLNWSLKMNNQSQVTPVIRVENTDIPVTVYQADIDSPQKPDDTDRTTTLSGQPHPTAFAVFLRPKFHYGRDDRPKYKTFGEYASRLNAVVESRLPTTNGKVFKLNVKETFNGCSI